MVRVVLLLELSIKSALVLAEAPPASVIVGIKPALTVGEIVGLMVVLMVSVVIRARLRSLAAATNFEPSVLEASKYHASVTVNSSDRVIPDLRCSRMASSASRRCGTKKRPRRRLRLLGLGSGVPPVAVAINGVVPPPPQMPLLGYVTDTASWDGMLTVASTGTDSHPRLSMITTV